MTSACQPAHGALLNLERSSASPLELLDEAARILGVSFSDIQHDLTSTSKYNSTTEFPAFAPKEEWAFRWLLKKTGPGSSTPSPDVTGVPDRNIDARKWLLFYHLVPRVSINRLTKILRDHDGMGQIQNALIQLSTPRIIHHSSRSSSTRRTSPGDSFETIDHEPPPGGSKKRKRSSVSKEPSNPDSSTLHILVSILKVLEVCADYALGNNTADDSARNQLRVALSLTPAVAASVLQNLFQTALYIFQDRAGGISAHHVLDLLQKSLRLWELRRGLDLGHTGEESNKVFTAHLLSACMSMINHIRTENLQQRYGDFASRIEKLIALHSVHPARKLFFDELAVTWKSSSDPLLSEHIQPGISRLQDILFNTDDSDPTSEAAGQQSRNLGLLSPILLEIAIRSSPRSTIAKIQHEQPWLEALFVCLADVEGCSLVRNFKMCSEKSLICLEVLLGTVLEWKLSLSPPIVTSLTEHCSGLCSTHFDRWSLVEKLMELEINIFLPNSGLSSARRLLGCLVEGLNAKSRSPSFGSETGVRILSRLMEGFASARDLAGFVDTWMSRLATLEDGRETNFREARDRDLYNLWEDECLIERFFRTARASATPYFVESHLIATTEALRNRMSIGTRYAFVLVLDTLISTNEEDTKPAESILRELYDELQQAIPTVDTFGKLKAWLWRLLRHIVLLVHSEFPLPLFQDMIDGKERPIVETAMQHARSPISYFTEVERFHCFFSTARSNHSAIKRHLDIEVGALTRYLSGTTAIDGEAQRHLRLWDGRMASLESRPLVSMAFLGILLQRPHLLCRNVEGTINLLKTLLLHAASEVPGGQKSQTGFDAIFEGFLLSEDLTSTPGLIKACIKAAALMEADGNSSRLKILQALPREAMSKWQRKQIGEWQRQKLEGVQQKQLDSGDRGSASVTSSNWNDSRLDARMVCSDFRVLCREARQASASTSPESIDEICEAMNTKPPPGAAMFVHLGSMLYRAESSPSITQTTSTLLTLLPKSKSVEEFCLNADCIKIILEKIPTSINQWTVDNLLACVAVALSPQGWTITDAASVIFERLCRLIGVILSRHRIRLGGRYHLLLPVLNSLLRCLFAPDPRSLSSQSQLIFHARLPPWIHSTSTTKLNKNSATQLTRLLTSICDPTPSSVRKSKSTRDSLTDETKKAKRVAGEYMQYFIAEYTYCQLNGRIHPDAKQGLMPGLYSAMDAMGRKVMRAMNAAMDANQRAIWKTLYEDWSKFGKWNGM